jgi:Fe2+ or Zn2+ uptake regulation protein
MGQMYNRLQSTKKRALAHRQREILQKLLELNEPITLDELYERLARPYQELKAPVKAFFRDLNYLLRLKAIKAVHHKDTFLVSVRLEWATEITETKFYEEMNKLPEAKTHLVISHWD